MRGRTSKSRSTVLNLLHRAQECEVRHGCLDNLEKIKKFHYEQLHIIDL